MASSEGVGIVTHRCINYSIRKMPASNLLYQLQQLIEGIRTYLLDMHAEPFPGRPKTIDV